MQSAFLTYFNSYVLKGMGGAVMKKGGFDPTAQSFEDIFSRVVFGSKNSCSTLGSQEPCGLMK